MRFQKMVAKYVVPECDGVFSGLEFRTNLWHKYSTAAPAQLRQYGAQSSVVRKAYKRSPTGTDPTPKRQPSGASVPRYRTPEWVLNRTLREATVQRYHYQTTAELNEHLQAFLLACNHAKRLKTLRGLTPHEFVCAQWQKGPVIFTRH